MSRTWNALAFLVTIAPSIARTQSPTTLHLAVSAPPAESVTVTSGRSYVTGDTLRRFDVYRPRGVSVATKLPVVVFVTGGTVRDWLPYIEWSRIVAKSGMAAVMYDADYATGASDLRALLAALRRDGASLGVDGESVVIWASSGNTTFGTPVALDSTSTQVVGYVLYYGAGQIAAPRIDIPVLIARAGLDTPDMNRSLDALAARLLAAGAPVRLTNTPAGHHAFDWFDRTPSTQAVVDETVAFMKRAVDPVLRRDVAAGVMDARAASALAAERWADAIALHERLASQRPNDPQVALKLGLARCGGGAHASALTAFDRARELGVSGGMDLGVHAVRAAVRANDRPQSIRWILWTLNAMPERLWPMLRNDREIAPLLEIPEVAAAMRK